MHRFVFATLALVACTRATPDPGMTKEPASPARSTAASSSAPGSSSLSASARPSPPADAEIDSKFVDEAKQIFATYKVWGRVDDEMRREAVGEHPLVHRPQEIRTLLGRRIGYWRSSRSMSVRLA